MSTTDHQENIKCKNMDKESVFNVIIHEDNRNTNKAHIVFRL